MYCHEISALCASLTEVSCLVSRTRAVLLTDFDSSSLNTGLCFFLSSLNHSEMLSYTCWRLKVSRITATQRKLMGGLKKP